MNRMVAWGVTLIAIAAVGLVHARAPLERRADDDSRFIPRPDVARVASLGFQPLVANFYWMQAVQVVGAEPRNPAKHADLLGRLIDVVTTVDPWVGHPYRFAAHWLTETPEQVRFANRLLERAIEHHPDDWRQYFYLGFNHFFYLDDSERAADRIEEASTKEGAPIYLVRLAARLRAGTAGLETASALLSELVQSTEDPKARHHYEAALLEIETERRARVLDEARVRFKEARGRDIRSVDELAAVLPRMPEDPYGDGWKLADDGRIVAVHLGRRYEPWMHENDRKRREIIEIEMGSGES